MKELYIPFTIPNLEQMQLELLSAIKHDYKTSKKPHAFSYPLLYMQKACPMFCSWILPKLKSPIRILRYYVTPPYKELGMHIDGSIPTVPFSMNIPLKGTKNTLHTYYETSADNLIYETPKGYLGGTHPLDYKKCKKIIDLEIDRPYILNNEVLHGVKNNSNEHRVMFTVRWLIHATLYRNIEEVMVTDDLFLNHI